MPYELTLTYKTACRNNNADPGLQLSPDPLKILKRLGGEIILKAEAEGGAFEVITIEFNDTKSRAAFDPIPEDPIQLLPGHSVSLHLREHLGLTRRDTGHFPANPGQQDARKFIYPIALKLTPPHCVQPNHDEIIVEC